VDASPWSSSAWADDADLTAYLSTSTTYTHAMLRAEQKWTELI